MPEQFTDRADAGRRLAVRLTHLAFSDVVVLALPRGGVPVAREVAAVLNAPLGLLLVRKIGAPGQPELAIGAIVDNAPPQAVLDEDMVRRTGAGQEYVARKIDEEMQELERRRVRYGPHVTAPDIKGRTVVVVDDGVATGSTLHAALQALRHAGVIRLVAAVPVIASEALSRLAHAADQWVYLLAPQYFHAVGNYYRDFSQLTDDEVMRLLGPRDE
jgi:putative phosphoribosyl transferase